MIQQTGLMGECGCGCDCVCCCDCVDMIVEVSALKLFNGSDVLLADYTAFGPVSDLIADNGTPPSCSRGDFVSAATLEYPLDGTDTVFHVWDTQDLACDVGEEGCWTSIFTGANTTASTSTLVSASCDPFELVFDHVAVSTISPPDYFTYRTTYTCGDA